MTEVKTLATVKNTASLLRDGLPSIRQALPAHIDDERYAQAMLILVNSSPALLHCTRSSFMLAVLQCATLGLDPSLGEAHIIPYRNKKRGITEANFQIDYKGLARLALRSGRYRSVYAKLVRENDEIEVELGDSPRIRHLPNLKKDRGEVTHAYAVALPREDGNGAPMFEIMNREEIEAIRARSRSGNSGPWVTDWGEMARKTPFRRLSKWLDLSPEAQIAVQADDLHATGQVEEANRLVSLYRASPSELAAGAMPGMEPTEEEKGDPEGDDLTEALGASLGAAGGRTPEPAGQVPAPEPSEPEGPPGKEEEAALERAEEIRIAQMIRDHVDKGEGAWIGNMPNAGEAKQIIPQIEDARVLRHMLSRNAYKTLPPVYTDRLRELGEDVEEAGAPAPEEAAPRQEERPPPAAAVEETATEEGDDERELLPF